MNLNTCHLTKIKMWSNCSRQINTSPKFGKAGHNLNIYVVYEDVFPSGKIIEYWHYHSSLVFEFKNEEKFYSAELVKKLLRPISYSFEEITNPSKHKQSWSNRLGFGISTCYNYVGSANKDLAYIKKLCDENSLNGAQYNMLSNNCQNWTREIIKKLGFTNPNSEESMELCCIKHCSMWQEYLDWPKIRKENNERMWEAENSWPWS